MMFAVMIAPPSMFALCQRRFETLTVNVIQQDRTRPSAILVVDHATDIPDHTTITSATVDSLYSLFSYYWLVSHPLCTLLFQSEFAFISLCYILLCSDVLKKHTYTHIQYTLQCALCPACHLVCAIGINIQTNRFVVLSSNSQLSTAEPFRLPPPKSATHCQARQCRNITILSIVPATSQHFPFTGDHAIVCTSVDLAVLLKPPYLNTYCFIDQSMF